jgi:MFS family permease
MKRASAGQLITLNAYWVGLSFMWNSLHPIILPAVLLNFVPEAKKNTYLGILTFAGLIIAMIIQPISGALSDRWRSRWGRRKPLILLGTAGDFLFLFLLGWAGGLGWLMLGYVGLQFSSNIAHGPLQGLLPDRVARDQLGTASGLKNLMDMAGLVVASLAAGRLLDPQASNTLSVIGVVAAVLFVFAAITILGTPEQPTLEDSPATTNARRVGFFQVDFRAHTAYWWLIGSRFAFLIGIYGIQAFVLYYPRDVLQVPNPAKQTGDLLAMITITLIFLALIGGWLSDRVGARKTLVAASVLASLGCILLLFARTPQTLLLYGSVVGAGIGLFLTANWALANRLAPPDEAGKFLGLTNLATAGAGAAGRLEGPLIDLLNSLQPGAFYGYTAMFLFGALTTLCSSLFLKWITETEN